jgi:hypothetical protein
MKFGASMFFTDYSMTPAALARALEERGFHILWAPEHSHIPLSRKTPFVLGTELPKRYYDVMDPFVTLTAAAAATTTLKLGTGVCLIAQRDAIQTAKLVASIDQVSGGRSGGRRRRSITGSSLISGRWRLGLSRCRSRILRFWWGVRFLTRRGERCGMGTGGCRR